MTLLSRIGTILRRRNPVELALMAADRVTRPVGLSLISFTPYAATPAPASGETAETRFDAIAEDNLWGSSESLSGGGSEVGRTAAYRKQLTALLGDFGSMFDAPCGDLNWMPLVLRELPHLRYSGGDISAALIERNRKRFPDLDLRQFDITRDPFPQAELWHCRDCLFHLSYRDAFAALANFAASSIPHALLTTHGGLLRNVDISTGGWRYLDLRRAPFNLPEPERLIPDYRFGDLPRFVGLWKRQTIAEAIGRAGGKRA